MKELYGIGGGVAVTAAIVLMASQSALAAPTQVTNVRVSPSGNGFDVILDTVAGDRLPQVFNVNRGNTWTAYVFNTQLQGQGFKQDNPAPGIASVAVSPVGGNGIQVVVVGQSAAPIGQVTSRTPQSLVFGVTGAGGTVAQAPASTQPATPTQPAAPIQPPAPAQPNVTPPKTTPVAPLVPNPQVTFSGTPAVPTAPVPPLLQRAIAPPVGDIALSQLDASPNTIDLGTAERIPRLVLRDAPVREVLSLLARAAGMNLAFAESPAAQAGQARPGATASGGPTISLDIENESVQDVFNYVLRIACVPTTGTAGGGAGGSQCASLDASRSGRTIFVGPRLPNAAKGVIARSVRLNQMNVASAVNFLVGLGAESAVTRERQIRTVVAQGVAQLEGAQQATAQQPAVETTTETRVEVQKANFQDSTPLLRGLQVIADERTNSITIVGAPKLVEFATNQLVHLDSRRRMVAVNVKVVDVNLVAIKRSGTSFSFGVGQVQAFNEGGVGVVNFGRNVPGGSEGANTRSAPLTFADGNIGSVVGLANRGSTRGFARDFFLQLQAAVTNGNAKVLTDPTLVVQEGQTATVNLTQEVVTNFKQETTGGAGVISTLTVTIEKRAAGLILPVKVDRIDDNGYISLSVAPSISQPERTVAINISGTTNNVTLLSERKLESGQIRLRDGQTLVLSGIIQEQDRVQITKVPILGDLPLLGSLFRRSERSNERREVIVILTPQIIDDSDRSSYGYSYVPGPEAQKMIREQNR